MNGLRSAWCLVLLVGVASAQFTRVNPEECDAAAAFDSDAPEQTIGNVSQCGAEDACTYKVEVASDFVIEYGPDYKVVRNLFDNEVHVLYPCGAQQPSPLLFDNEGGDVNFFEVPLTAVAVSDSSVSWYLELLGVADRVRYASSFSTSPCMIKLATANATAGGCPGRVFNATATAPRDYDALFTFTGPNPTGKEIAFTATSDPGVLNRVEWLLYVGAFFNREAEAVAQFRAIRDAYLAAAVEPTPASPTVAWVSYLASLFGVVDAQGNPVEGPGLVVSFAPYKVEISTAAGANYPNEAAYRNATLLQVTNPQPSDVYFVPGPSETLADAAEAVKPLLRNVDIVIDETFTFTDPADPVADFMNNWGISAAEKNDFPFLANGQLWKHDKDQATTGGDDWFGEAVVRADVVLRDMRAVIAPGAAGEYETEFFRNTAAGEARTTAGLEECEDMQCNSFANQAPIVPAAAPVPTPSSPAPEAPAPAPADAGSGTVHAAGRMAIGAVAFAALLL